MIGDVALLDWTIIFLVLAFVAGILGFGGFAQESAGIAKILFVVFLVIYIASFFVKSKVEFEMRPSEGKIKLDVRPKK